MFFSCVLLLSLVPWVCLSPAVSKTVSKTTTKEKDSFDNLGDNSIDPSDFVIPGIPEDLSLHSSIVNGSKGVDIQTVEDDEGKTTGTHFLKEEISEKERELNDTIQARSFLTRKHRLWGKNNKGLVEIPYVFGHVDDIISQNYFPRFVKYFAEHTCVRWVPKQSHHSRHVRIFSGKNGRCHATLGAGYGAYEMHLSASCAFIENIVPHEMMHILGFIHEHQRQDRDCYITVSARGLSQDHANMQVYTYEPSDTSFPYDPHSVMQYPSYGDMTWKDDPRRALGPVHSMPSLMDLVKINHVYCDQPHWCYWYDCKAHKQRQANCNQKRAL